MSRLKACLHVAVLQFGLAYIALWAITFLALDYGPLMFGGSCSARGSQLLFYWVCASLPILLLHLIGPPAALLVSIRALARLIETPRWLAKRRGSDNDEELPHPVRVFVPAPSAAPPVKARTTFGLRGQNPDRFGGGPVRRST